MSVPAPNDSLWRCIGAAIADRTHQPFTLTHVRPVPGGCINDTAVIGNGDVSYFVKLNSAQCVDMFEAEADGLRELSGSGALRIPSPVCFGTDHQHAWLVLEYLGAMKSHTSADWSLAGRSLAMMHRQRQNVYGWYRDNAIGSTPQKNDYCGDWIEFLRKQRIGYQLDLAARNGYDGHLQTLGRRLLDRLPGLFTDYVPDASLLHGDLWSGNIGFVEGGQPVVFDPAVYYGDRETDVAMTELFGGFAQDFYRGYEEIWPLDQGFRVRKHVYNLYHLLNHLNLFGAGYLSQCESRIEQVLAQRD